MADAVPADEKAGSEKEKSTDDLLKTARDRFQKCKEQEQQNRERALQSLRFRDLDQWPQTIRSDRENDPEGSRPCLVADKLNQYVHQVVNDGRQNRPSIKARPVDNVADKEVAKVFDGIIRHIEDASRAHVAYDTGLEHAVDGGFGYWRIVTEYSDEMSFEQDIRIKRIRNRFCVYLDPDHQEPDGSDAKYGFILDRMPREEFKKAYPDADPLEWETDGQVYDGWVFKDDLIVCEYFRVEQQKKSICLWSDGSVSVKGENEEQYTAAGLQKVDERVTRVPSVKWSKITAADELESRDWAGKYIPIVKVVGNELDIEGKLKLSGLVFPAMDSQRIHNYALSAFVEQIALAPRAPWIAAAGQLEGFENEWKTANRRNLSVLQYKPVDENGQLVPPPIRQQPPGIPQGWQAVLADTEHGIEASMGMYKAAVGAPSNEKSGRAIVARERQSDTATFHFIDNVAISIAHTGRILIDLIPKIYDTQRVARILGDDGDVDTVTLNPEQPQAVSETRDDETQEIEKIYNLGVGKYDVTVTVGPSYSTKRQESAAIMAQIAQAWPPFMERAGDLAIRSQDWPDADKLADRLKLFLPPQVQGMEDGKESPEMRQAKAMVDAAQKDLAGKAHELAMAHQELGQAQQKVGQEAMRVEYEKQVMVLRERFFREMLNAKDQANSAELKAEIDRAMSDMKTMIEEQRMQDRELTLASVSAAVGQVAGQLDDSILGIRNKLDAFEVASQNEQ